MSDQSYLLLFRGKAGEGGGDDEEELSDFSGSPVNKNMDFPIHLKFLLTKKNHFLILSPN